MTLTNTRVTAVLMAGRDPPHKHMNDPDPGGSAMAAGRDLGPDVGLFRTLDIRPVGVDVLSSVRYVHASALRSQGPSFYSAEELDAFENMVRSVRYAETVLKDTMVGGWIGHDLVGTAAWGVVDDRDRKSVV